MSSKQSNTFTISDFSEKVIKATSIICIILLGVFLILKGFKVILLVLAGILVATFFRGIASLFQRKFPLSDKWALVLATAFVLLVCTTTVIALYPRVSSQLNIMEKELPEAYSQAKEKLKQNKVGQYTINQLKKYQDDLKKNNEQLTVFFSSFFGGLADFYIILFLGIFFMAQPKMYQEGIILLFPKPKRKRAEEVLLTMAYTLKRWLMGKILSMLVVGILTGIGLAILGIPLALTLGLFATLITFIPNFGPIISLVPALLIALTMGTDYAIYVTILYAVIQAIESNVITPLIQRRMIAFPLAMILIAQVLLGIFTGGLGLILAVPVIAIIMVLVKMVYIEDILDDNSVEVVGEELFTDQPEEGEEL